MLVSPVKALLKQARGMLHQIHHPHRHRRALERVRRLGTPRRVLLICTGNVCRSPYAEAALRRSLGVRGWSEVVVDSIGFIGPGREADAMAQSIATRRGMDLRAHLSRTLASTDPAAWDLCLVMTAKQRRDLCRVWKIDPARVELLGNLDPSLTDPPDIVDPWGRPAEIFESVFQRIDRCLETLAGLAYPHRPVAAPAAESGGDIAA